MNKLYTITGISIVALSLFTGSALAHGTQHQHQHQHQHHKIKKVLYQATVVQKHHHKMVKKPHPAIIRHKMAQSAQNYKRLISLELSNPHPNMRKLRMLRHAMVHDQARYAQHLKH